MLIKGLIQRLLEENAIDPGAGAPPATPAVVTPPAAAEDNSAGGSITSEQIESLLESDDEQDPDLLSGLEEPKPATETPPAQPPVATPPVETPPVVAAPPVPATPPATPAAAAPATPPVAQPPATPSPLPVAPPAAEPPVVTPEAQAAQRVEQRKAYVTELKGKYKLPARQDDEMFDPDTHLPELAAELHVGVTEAVISGIASMMPMMIQQHMESVKIAERNEQEFFTAWPLLTPADKPTVARFMQSYLATNPNATRDQVIQEVGAMSMTALRRVAPVVQSPGAPAAPVAAAAAPAGSPGFIPAQPGAAGGAAPGRTPPPANPYEQFVQEVLDDGH